MVVLFYHNAFILGCFSCCYKNCLFEVEHKKMVNNADGEKKSYSVVLNKEQAQYVDDNFIKLGKLVRKIIDEKIKVVKK